ncbi:MAG: S1C family serine protease, partial [Dehalococcoidia bacterium]
MQWKLRTVLVGTLLLAVLATACDDDDASTSTANATAEATQAGAQAVTSTSTAGSSGAAMTPAAASPSAGSANSAEAVVQNVRQAVVLIRAGATQAGPFGQVQRGEGTGSGFIIDPRGYIVTNNHVVTLGTDTPATQFQVGLDDGRMVPATLVGRDARSDLAVLKIEAQNLQALEWATPESIAVGEEVLAIGFPLDLGRSPTVTNGVVSAKDRVINETIEIDGQPYRIDISGAIQTDAAINPGNSGGPLVDLDGRVVGVNTAGLVVVSGQPVQGIFFAVSSQVAQPITEALIESGNVERGYLGVQVVTVDRETARANGLTVESGAAIVSAEPGSPAARAGMQAGDVITKIGDMAVANTGDLTRGLFDY